MKIRTYKFMIYIAELLSTQALFIPIKVLFFIHFLIQNDNIAFLKFLFILFSFIFELPSGYFSDKFGNKKAILLSKAFTILAIICNCVLTNFIGFALSNIILGLASAWSSGANDSFFLILCKNFNFDYNQIKLKVVKYSYIINFVLMTFSSMLYGVNIFLPFILTAVLFFISIIIILILPKDKINICENNSLENSTKLILNKILHNPQLIIQILFTVICTSILISNFDFYTPIFREAGISIDLIGIIFASFMLVNTLGVQIYESNIVPIIKKILFIILPFSFVFLNTKSVVLIFCGVFIQQLCFSYYNMNLSICILENIDDLSISSFYQSVISFINVILRLILTLGVTLLYKIFEREIVFFIFAVITFFATIFYFSKIRKEDYEKF